MQGRASGIQELHKASYFIGVNNAGCMFDSMELVHKKAFIPALCEIFQLGHIQGLVEEVWTSMNLYSRQRGLNRFQALVRTVEELHSHPVLKRFPGVLAAILPDVAPLRAWIDQSTTLSNESLEREILRKRQLVSLIDHGRSDIQETLLELEQVLHWSERVNELIKAELYQLSPLNGAVNFLKMIRPLADGGRDPSVAIVVLSQSPGEIVQHQWEKHRIATYVDKIHGQEDGAAVTLLKRYVREGGFSGRMLIIGDSPSDYESAQSIGANFYPILPHREAESWDRLSYEAWPIFATGSYTLEYQNRLLNNFFLALSKAQRPESTSKAPN